MFCSLAFCHQIFGSELRLKESEEARSICISIEKLECAGELVGAMTKHAEELVALYRSLRELTGAGMNDEEKYEPLFHKAAALSDWFKARKRVANSMKAASK